jgi:hypothetical protein
MANNANSVKKYNVKIVVEAKSELLQKLSFLAKIMFVKLTPKKVVSIKINFNLLDLSLMAAAAYISTTVVGEIWVALHIVGGLRTRAYGSAGL